MPVANPHRGDVTLVLDGRTRVLRPTFGAMLALEQIVGMSLPDLSLAVFKDGTVTLRVDQAQQILAACLVPEPGVGDDVRQMAPDGGFMAVAQACSTLLVNMITGGAPPMEGAAGE